MSRREELTRFMEGAFKPDTLRRFVCDLDEGDAIYNAVGSGAHSAVTEGIVREFEQRGGIDEAEERPPKARGRGRSSPVGLGAGRSGYRRRSSGGVDAGCRRAGGGG